MATANAQPQPQWHRPRHCAPAHRRALTDERPAVMEWIEKGKSVVIKTQGYSPVAEKALIEFVSSQAQRKAGSKWQPEYTYEPVQKAKTS